MKKVDISTLRYPNTFAMVDDEDFGRINANKWSATSVRKNLSASRSKLSGGLRTPMLMHRIIMNAPKGSHVDHINHNTLDNRKSNLRVCTQAENAKNRLVNSNNTSGYKGVSWVASKGKWLASITCNKKVFRLGHYRHLEDAATAYDIAAIEKFGEFAHLNTIDYTKQSSPVFDGSLYLDSHPAKAEITSLEERQLLFDAIESLSDRNREIIELRYGLIDGISKTHREIGTIVKLTTERVRQIKRKLLQELKNQVTS